MLFLKNFCNWHNCPAQSIHRMEHNYHFLFPLHVTWKHMGPFACLLMGRWQKIGVGFSNVWKQPVASANGLQRHISQPECSNIAVCSFRITTMLCHYHVFFRFWFTNVAVLNQYVVCYCFHVVIFVIFEDIKYLL